LLFGCIAVVRGKSAFGLVLQSFTLGWWWPCDTRQNCLILRQSQFNRSVR